MAQTGPTKAELQGVIDQVSDILSDALDPALTREEVIQKIQEADEIINPDESEEEEEQEEEG